VDFELAHLLATVRYVVKFFWHGTTIVSFSLAACSHMAHLFWTLCVLVSHSSGPAAADVKLVPVDSHVMRIVYRTPVTK
jgi:hypothetical protein